MDDTRRQVPLGSEVPTHRLLYQQSVLHNVLTGACHLRSCPDVETFIFQESGLQHILRKLLVGRH